MGQKAKSVSLAAIMLLSTLSAILVAAPAAATQVVITEAIQVVDGGSSSDRMSAVSSDSQGNVHVVWSRSNPDRRNPGYELRASQDIPS